MLVKIEGMLLQASRGRILTRFRWGVLGASASVALLASAASCSSSSTSPPTSLAPPGCPTSFGAANGAACATAAQSCDYVAPCGPFGTPATCVCTDGVYVCRASLAATDGAAPPVPVSADASTLCEPSVTAPACPATEQKAMVAICTDLGQQCAYPSGCNSIPAFDQCLCVGGRTTIETPHFECTAPCDVTGAPPRDAGTGPDAADARAADANAPDARALDAAPDSPAPLDAASE
jgi:hypothetical protein